MNSVCDDDELGHQKTFVVHVENVEEVKKYGSDVLHILIWNIRNVVG
jgi:hypothetical protein